MESKHGMSQYRLNRAKSYAQSFLETVSKIEFMYQLSLQCEVIINNGEKFFYNYVDKEENVGHCHVNALDLKNNPDSLTVEIKSK